MKRPPNHPPTTTGMSLLIHLALVALAQCDPMDGLSPMELSPVPQQMQMMGPQPVKEFSTDHLGLGQVSALALDSMGDLYVFHRGVRSWTMETFEPMEDVLTAAARKPIESEAIVRVDPVTGQEKDRFGANIFNVPHGLTIDSKDNIWVTDVGRHQVMRFPNGSSTPDLVLGEKFVPGDDNDHFCKPTDVAVAANGDFFVADGYCNSRVLKFSKDGKLLSKWGTSAEYVGPVTPYHLSIPHSVTLVEDLDLVCVADRENQRATCFNAGLGNGRPLGSYNRTIIERGEAGKVFAISFNKADRTFVAAVEISRRPYLDEMLSPVYPPRAITVGLRGELVEVWAPILPMTASKGDSLIHAVCASNDGQDFFLADILQKKVLKFTNRGRRPLQL